MENEISNLLIALDFAEINQNSQIIELLTK